MSKMGTMPHYLYTSSILTENARETTPYEDSQYDPENREEEQVETPDHFDSSSDEEECDDEELPTQENLDALSFDRGSLFLVGRSSRFGRSIKINNKLLSWLDSLWSFISYLHCFMQFCWISISITSRVETFFYLGCYYTDKPVMQLSEYFPLKPFEKFV